MKLNYDAVRAALVYMEEALKYEDTTTYIHTTITIKSVIDALAEKYSKEDIAYATEQLLIAGFIESKANKPITNKSHDIQVSTQIRDITYQGHELLNSIRNEKNWEKIKKFINEKVIDVSIFAIFEASKTVISSLISL